MNLLKLIHCDDIDIFTSSKFSDSASQDFKLNFRILTNNETVVIVQGMFSRLSNSRFNVRLMDARDITEKSSRSGITELNLKAMLKNTDDFIFFKDANHIMTASSDSLALLTGYQKGEDILGKSDYELFPKEHADFYYKLEKELYKGTLSHVAEVQPFVNSKGIKGWVDNRKYPIKNSHGEIVALFGVARDITKLKNAEIKITKINEDLSNSRDMLYKLTQNVPGLIYQFKLFPDGRMCFPYASQTITEIYEVQPEDVIDDAQAVVENIHPDDLPVLISSIEKSAQAMQDWSMQYRVNLPKKGLRWLQGFARPEKLEDGSVLWHGYIYDATQEKAHLELFEQQVLEHKTVLETTLDGFWVVNEVGEIIDVNEAYCRMSGYSRDELLGMKVSDIEFAESEEETRSHIEKIKQNKTDTFDTVHLKKDGKELNVNITVTSIQSNGMKFITSIRDTTKNKQYEKEIKQLAYFDKLTKLPNRALLTERIEYAIKHANRNKSDLAICMVDLDGFKDVNDAFGHHAGDCVLIEAARRMKAEVREDDTVGRLGGDEFLIILTDITSSEDCALVLERILDSLSQEYIYKGQKINSVSASIGVSMYPNDKVHSDALLRHADVAMYKAKNSGKNRFTFFDIASENKVQETSKIIHRMRDAINSNQFCLYYQPKYQTSSNLIDEVEALVRWKHPTLGLLSPAEFLPVIQSDDSLSLLLDQWVVNKAIKQLIEWNKKNIKLKVCINISPKQFKGELFQDWLCDLIESRSISQQLLNQIEIEILETAVIDNLVESNKFIHRLQERGISFALDDFGTGYSSLMHLKSLPINTIKIDQLFVKEMLENSASMTIVKAVIALSQAFELSVTAEGAETMEHVYKLIEMGCDEIQGYAISHPLPASELLEFIANFKFKQKKN